MVVETNLEREFKFDVDPDFDPPDLRPIVGRTERLPEQHLTTTYYDTGALDLWGQGITLRYRVETTAGPAAGSALGKWTLKLPALATDDADDAGDRWELSWKASGDRVPDETRDIVRGLIRHELLEPVLILAANRRRLLLRGPEGAAWGEIDDDLVEVVSGRREGFRFRQLELELIGEAAPDGAPVTPVPAGQTGAVLDALRASGARPGGGAKFALAAGLESGGPAGAAPKATTGDFISAVLRADAELWLEVDYRLRVPDRQGDPGRPDAEVVRLAARSIGAWRSHLSALAPGLDPVWRAHVGRDVTWVAGLVDRVRALDVVMRKLGGGHGATPGGTETRTEELRALVAADRHLAALELVEAQSTAAYDEMLGRMHAARHSAALYGVAPDMPADEFLRDILRARWRRARKAIRGAGADWEARVAKRARRLEDTARMGASELGRRATHLAAIAADVADPLSEAADARLVAHVLGEMAFHPAMTPMVAFEAGRVAARAEDEAGRLADGARLAAARLARRRRGAWLG